MTVHTYFDPAQVSVTLRAGGRALTTPRGWLTAAAMAAAGTWAVHTALAHPAVCISAATAFGLGLGIGYARGRRIPGRAVLTVAVAAFTMVGTALTLTMTSTPLLLRVLVTVVLWALATTYAGLALTQARRDRTATATTLGAVAAIRPTAAIPGHRSVDPDQRWAAPATGDPSAADVAARDEQSGGHW